MACLGSAGHGLTCLDQAGWRSLTTENSPLGSNTINQIAVCPEGEFVFASRTGIDTFDGQNWKRYYAGWGSAGPDAIACEAGDRFWVAHFRGVSYFDGEGWTTYPASQLATGDEATDLVRDVALDPSGRVWVVTASSVACLDDQQWKVYQAGDGLEDRHFFGQAAVDDWGRPWAVHSSGLLVFEQGAWYPFPNPDLYPVSSLAVDGLGRAWVGTLNKGLYVLEGSGWLIYSAQTHPLASNHIQALVIDGNNRVWVGTPYGLTVVDGESWQTFRMDSAELVDHDVRTLAVAAGGPTLPNPQPKPPGSLRGRFLLPDGTPVTQARVELCVESRAYLYPDQAPCAGQPFATWAETDAAGQFAFSELPVGYYVVTVQMAAGWVQLTAEHGLVSQRVPVRSGEVTDLGELVIESEE